MRHIWLCWQASDKENFTQPISRNKTTFFNASYVCYVKPTSTLVMVMKRCELKNTCWFCESARIISINKFFFFWKLLCHWRKGYEDWVAAFWICLWTLLDLSIATGDHVGKLLKDMLLDSKLWRNTLAVEPRQHIFCLRIWLKKQYLI